VAKNQWHTLRVEFGGEQISRRTRWQVYIESSDARIVGSGAVGVWTKADSVTAFDDFTFGASPSNELGERPSAVVWRGLRAFGDGYVSLLLPVYLISLGLTPFQVGSSRPEHCWARES